MSVSILQHMGLVYSVIIEVWCQVKALHDIICGVQQVSDACKKLARQ